MKYEMTAESVTVDGVTLHRIRAIADFFRVKKDDLGGWIEGSHNLSQTGDAWVGGKARVYGKARVCDDARVYGNACVYGNAWVDGRARVYDDARVYGNAWVNDSAWVYDRARVCDGAWVGGNAQVYGNALVYDRARVYGNARVYGDALVYGNARVGGDASVLGRVSITPVVIYGGPVDATLMDYELSLGCVCKRLAEWWGMTDAQIELLAKDHYVARWAPKWHNWKPIIFAIAEATGRWPCKDRECKEGGSRDG